MLNYLSNQENANKTNSAFRIDAQANLILWNLALAYSPNQWIVVVTTLEPDFLGEDPTLPYSVWPWVITSHPWASVLTKDYWDDYRLNTCEALRMEPVIFLALPVYFLLPLSLILFLLLTNPALQQTLHCSTWLSHQQPLFKVYQNLLIPRPHSNTIFFTVLSWIQPH